MSLLHLLGVNCCTFDGKSIDEAVNNISGYCNTKFNEDEGENANDTLADIESEASNIPCLEDISINVDNMIGKAEDLFSTISQSLQQVKKAQLCLEELDLQDSVLVNIKDYLDSIEESLMVDNSYINVPYMFGQYYPFVPKYAYYWCENGNHLYKSLDRNFVFVIKSVTDWRDNVELKPVNILYKNTDYIKAYNKTIELGINPENVSDEDYSLLMMLDEHNKVVYDMFKDNRKNK